jgi:hypothetical protein
MSINGSVASFLPFTINGLTDASFSNSNLGVATATALTLTSATPLKLARFDLDKNLVSASVDESEVAVLTSNVFDGTQTMKPGHTTNINNVFETTIIANPPYDESSFTTSGISGYTAPLGTLTGPVAGEYSISQTASDRSIMKLNGFIPEVGRKYVYTFTIRIIDAPEAYVSVEQGGAQRSNTIIQIGSDNETISDTFTFDPSGSTLVFKIYTGSLDPWTATWSSFSLGYYEASINAPINNLTVTNLATELLAFPSTITNSESWSIYAISTMGNPSTLGGIVTTNISTGSTMYFTGDVLGAPNFQFTTLGNAGKVVCTNGNSVMSTTINAGQLEYITGLSSQAANSITTGSNKITQEYNATVGDISTLVNRATLDAGLALVPNLIPLNNIWTGTNQFNLNVSTGGTARFLQPYNATALDVSTLVNRATLDSAISGFSNILPLNNTWTGTNTFNNTVSVNATLSATYIGATTAYLATDDRTISPSEILAGTARFYFASYPNNGGTEYADAIGFNTYIDGSGGNENLMMLRKNSIGLRIYQGPFGSATAFSNYKDAVFAENTNVSGRFIPYASAINTLTNSLLNQIDDDSMGFGYTAIPNYPLGSGGKNMYINGSIFAGGLNSMVGTFGRDTNTSNPANEITFTANGAGVLLTQVKSHSGSSPFYDATWTYSNTNPAPLGANQGQVLLQADKLTMALTNGLVVNAETSTSGKLTVQDVVRFGNYSGGNYDNIQFMRGTGSGQYPNIRCQENYIAMYVSDAGGWVGGSAVGDMVIKPSAGVNLRLGIGSISGLVIDSACNVIIPQRELRISNLNGNGQIRLTNQTSGHGTLLYNDGGAFYFLLTNNGDVNGAFNSLRPFIINLTSGGVSMNQGATIQNGLSVNSGNTTLSNQVTLSGNVYTGVPSEGRIYWTNPVGSATHFGYPSGGGADNYIRGTQTYIDTPIIFNQAMSINAITYPQNTSPYSHVMTFNTSTGAVQRSQCMMRQLYINQNISWSGGVDIGNAFYKFNATCPVRISGKVSYFVTSATRAYPYLRIYSQTNGQFYYYSFEAYTNVTFNHATYPIDIVIDGSSLPALGWYDVRFYNAGNLVTDGNDQIFLFAQVLPVDSF